MKDRLITLFLIGAWGCAKLAGASMILQSVAAAINNDTSFMNVIIFAGGYILLSESELTFS